MQQVNEVTVTYSGGLKTATLPKITSSQSLVDLVYNQWDKDTIEMKETFKVVLMNNGNRVKGVCELSSGGITGCMVDIRILFATVLKSLSPSIILVHNHPSGKLTPSQADKDITKKIKEGCKLLDINLLDHVIINPEGEYYSFADEYIL